jgi:hypothetical protein
VRTRLSRGTNTLIMAVAFALIGGSVVGGIALTNRAGASTEVGGTSSEPTPTASPTDEFGNFDDPTDLTTPFPSASPDGDDHHHGDDHQGDDDGHRNRGHGGGDDDEDNGRHGDD